MGYKIREIINNLEEISLGYKSTIIEIKNKFKTKEHFIWKEAEKEMKSKLDIYINSTKRKFERETNTIRSQYYSLYK